MSKTKLSERVRPDCEAAPWVIEEIKRLEATLEAKAAPVGEREAFEEWFLTTGIPLTDINPYALASWDAWKACAAYQRQQGDERGHNTKGSRKALGAMNAKLKAKIGRLEREIAALKDQQAREVVMPERKELPDLLLATYHENRGWNACLDEFARLNKGVGSDE